MAMNVPNNQPQDMAAQAPAPVQDTTNTAPAPIDTTVAPEASAPQPVQATPDTQQVDEQQLVNEMVTALEADEISALDLQNAILTAGFNAMGYNLSPNAIAAITNVLLQTANEELNQMDTAATAPTDVNPTTEVNPTNEQGTM